MPGIIQGSTNFGFWLWYKRTVMSKKKIIPNVDPSRLFTKFTTENKESKKKNQSFLSRQFCASLNYFGAFSNPKRRSWGLQAKKFKILVLNLMLELFSVRPSGFFFFTPSVVKERERLRRNASYNSGQVVGVTTPDDTGLTRPPLRCVLVHTKVRSCRSLTDISKVNSGFQCTKGGQTNT